MLWPHKRIQNPYISLHEVTQYANVSLLRFKLCGASPWSIIYLAIRLQLRLHF